MDLEKSNIYAQFSLNILFSKRKRIQWQTYCVHISKKGMFRPLKNGRHTVNKHL